MLKIRLQRTGKRNRPEYRIVLAQKTAAASKKFVEVLGNYNPRNKDFTIKSIDRLKYWIAKHVEISPTVHNLFVTKNLLEQKKLRAFSTPKKEAKTEEAAPAPTAEATAEPVAEPDAEVTETPVETPTEAPAAE